MIQVTFPLTKLSLLQTVFLRMRKTRLIILYISIMEYLSVHQKSNQAMNILSQRFLLPFLLSKLQQQRHQQLHPLQQQQQQQQQQSQFQNASMLKSKTWARILNILMLVFLCVQLKNFLAMNIQLLRIL